MSNASSQTAWRIVRPADHEQGHRTSHIQLDSGEPVTSSRVAANLSQFRVLAGISSIVKPEDHSSDPGSARVEDQRAGPNIGIYRRIFRHEQTAKRKLKMTKFVVYVCLGLEMSIAAALTAMGAGKVNYIAITVLGAVNTVVSGLLSYVEGASYVSKLTSEVKEWESIRELIEQREREFVRDGNLLDVSSAMKEIEDIYEEAKEEIDATNTTAHPGNVLKHYRQVGNDGQSYLPKRRSARAPASAGPAIKTHDAYVQQPQDSSVENAPVDPA